MRRLQPYFFILITIICTSIFFSCGKKGCTDSSAMNYDVDADKSCKNCCEYADIDIDIDINDEDGKYLLVIEDGAKSTEQGKTITYDATFVDLNGTEQAATNVVWTCSSSDIGSFSGNVFTGSGEGSATITAKATIEGVEYTATVPVNITLPSEALLLQVVPSALLVDTEFDPIDLETIYFGSGTPSYSFSSGNSSVASVTSSGTVSFGSAGSTVITVTASVNGQELNYSIPVMVLGVPEIPLPITKVVVTPSQKELFRDETTQFTAKAYNSEGEDVTSSTSFTWMVENKDPDEPTVLNVTNSGLVTAQNIGNAYVYATAKGITAQAEVVVNPDSVLWIDPFYTSLGGFDWYGNPQPTEKTLTASAYKIDRDKYHAGDPNFYISIPVPSGLQWTLPITGISSVDDTFEVLELSNETSTSVLASAIDGKYGATVVIGYIPSSNQMLGACLVNVGF